MNRAETRAYILENYNVKEDHPWMDEPNYEVFRHFGNNKWFALILDVPKNKFGLKDDGILDVLNVKCDPIVVGGLLGEPGFFPAYHMSKDKWISIALDGTADDDKIKVLLDMSYNLTKPKVRKRRTDEKTDPA